VFIAYCALLARNPSLFSQDLRPFDFAQGRLWAIMCRPSGAGVCWFNLFPHLTSCFVPRPEKLFQSDSKAP